MKFNKLVSIALFTGLFTMVSCSQEEEQVGPVQNNEKNFLQITVSDAGVNGNVSSRAVEDGYKTTFTPNDEIGVYVVDMKTKKIYNPDPENGGMDASNRKFTLLEDGTWDPNGYGIERIEEEMEQLKFFAYYPYQANGVDFNVEVAAANTGGDPFAEAVEKWTINYEKLDTEYTKSDLMTSEATDAITVGAMGQVKFILKHRLSIAAIQMPNKVYEFQNTDPVIDPYKIPAVPESFIIKDKDKVEFNVNPYYDEQNGLYRILVKPNQEYTISGTFVLDGRKEFAHTRTAAEAKEGKAVKFKLKGSIVIDDQTLQIGDYYCADGSIIEKDKEAPQNAVGVIFFVGNPQPSALYDYTEYQDILKNTRPNCNHGLVIALNDANNGNTSKFSSNKAQDIDNWKNNQFAKGGEYINVMNKGDNNANLIELKGYNNTKLMQESQNYEPINKRSDLMCNILEQYQQSVPVLSISTNWFCPSYGELNEVTKNYQTIKSSIESAGGNLTQYPDILSVEWNKVKDTYWTSTVRNTDSQWVSGLNDAEIDAKKTGIAACNSSGNQQHFRFCLAF
ncbi:fimbrillin family protein [Bacteroides finegoldii]|uniref:fimbrillin family protein n=1 Tax=Bacteroides finegoldii TaxID=338188 RepID=UPI00189E53FA|nr:fimbrillin family protein [Bacteroides finegoldii]